MDNQWQLPQGRPMQHLSHHATAISHQRSIINNNTLSDFIDNLIDQAINQQASDIHCEPFQHHYQIRFRIDGLLREVIQPPTSIADQLTSRIKVMANLDIAERRLPQDGRWQYANINIRVSTCPTQYGEKIVLRLLNPNHQILPITNLGLTDGQKQHFLTTIQQPQGLIIITGPTGSGKTMTLYSAVQRLNHTNRNIVTIEDPVEIIVDGINQVAVNRKIKFDFASALRAFLRQDPDVIMVGEIRDHETATIALHAAQTGHLVFATLHSNSSHEALNRLVSMELDYYQIIHSVTLITAQRLLRKLCPHCKVAAPIDQTISSDLNLTRNIHLYHAAGCEHCFDGYHGRIAIHEQLPLNHQLLNQHDSQQIPSQLIQPPALSLKMRARQLALSGETSLAEIERVIPQ